MSRGHRSGLCPIYSLTVHGNGFVEHVGQPFVKDRGPPTATISAEQITALLENFDRVHFFRLKDRAFDGCDDTPWVSVPIWIEGKT
jgi:hypothetical protein